MTTEITVNTRGAQRLATLEAVRRELEQLLTPIEGGSLDGIQVVSKGEIDQAIANVKGQPLPPIDATTAEVTTPADIYVDAICPECNLPTRILAQLSTVLEEADPDQQDFGLEDIVRPEDALTDDEQEPDAGDVDLGEGRPNDEAAADPDADDGTGPTDTADLEDLPF